MATHSKFDGKTEASDVAAAFADQIRGKTILVTGAGPGGFGAALLAAILPYALALTIVTGRDISKVEKAIKSLPYSQYNVAYRLLKLDLVSIQSIREAAATVVGYAEQTIDIVINNAGVMNIPKRTLSPDGVELHLATNHLGHFLFVNLIKAKLSGARIVNVASNGHALSPIRFSDYNFDKMEIPEEEQPARAACEAFGVPWGVGYLPPIAYGQGITAFSVNPGAALTDLWRHMDKAVVDQISNLVPIKTADQAVATILVAALDPKLKESPGAYLDNCQITETAPFAMNEIAAQRLWDLSERLTAESP